MKLEDIRKEIGADRIKRRRDGIITVWKRQVKNPHTNVILDSSQELVERIKRHFQNVRILNVDEDFIRAKGKYQGHSYWVVNFILESKNKLFGTITTGEY